MDPKRSRSAAQTVCPGVTVEYFEVPPQAPFSASVIRIGAGRCSPVDAHEVRECWFVKRGSGTLTVDGRAHHIAAGELLYFDSGRRHQVRNDGDEELELYSVWWPP